MEFRQKLHCILLALLNLTIIQCSTNYMSESGCNEKILRCKCNLDKGFYAVTIPIPLCKQDNLCESCDTISDAARCLEHGQCTVCLSPDERGCYHSVNAHPVSATGTSGVSCPDPGIAENSKRTVFFASNIFEVGTRIETKCLGEYVMQGFNEMRCTSSGQWSNPLPKCVAPIDQSVVCPNPGIPYNSRRYIRWRYKPYGIGTTLEFECLDGFRLVGVKLMECTHSGQWSSQRPECTRIGAQPEDTLHTGPGIIDGHPNPDLSKSCNDPGIPVNSRRHVYFTRHQLEVGARMEFSCFTGYQLVGTQSITCTSAEVWTAPIPQCISTSTRRPTIVTHRPLLQPTYIPPTIRVPITEATGHVPVLRGCTLPNNIQFGQISVHINNIHSAERLPIGFYLPGTKLFYSCNEGPYVLRGESTRICGEDARWTGVEPHCERITHRSAGAVDDSACGFVDISGATPRISNYPWHVAIDLKTPDMKTSKSICGGTIISKTLILTSANCVVHLGNMNTLPASYFRVLVGRSTLEKNTTYDSQSEYEVAAIIVHPDYRTESWNNALALLRLREPIKYRTNVAHICLPQEHIHSPFQPFRDGQMSSETGFGLPQSWDRNETIITLRTTLMRIAEKETCKINVDSRLFCAEAKGGPDRICAGDEGGSLMFAPAVGMKFSIEGVRLSKNDNCTNETQLVTFLQVRPFVTWIQSYL